jgi:hypothetical protein
LPEEALANLAYYFEHDYADGRDLSVYSIALHEAVAAWEANSEKSRLRYSDDGTTLRIEDRRPDAADSELRLSGVERALYLFCDRYRSWSELLREAEALGWSEEELTAFLQGLKDRRLVAAADDRYLGLALSADAPADEAAETTSRKGIHLDPAELEAIRAKVDAWGPALTPRERALLETLLGAGEERA